MIQYTTDGKKVVKIGDLNSQEKIVQEVFIIEGKEVPSGEHFVVKALHDAPVESWKEKKLREIEELYNRDYKNWEESLSKLNKEYALKVSTIKAKLTFLNKLEVKLTEESFERLCSFISGEIKYLVVLEYDLKILEFNTKLASTEYGRFHALRLMSLYGKTDGNLDYKINQYYDLSGHWTTVVPCKTWEEALSVIQTRFNELLDKSGLNQSLLKVAKEYNLKIPQKYIDQYNDQERERIAIKVENTRTILNQLEEELQNITNDLY